VPEPLIVLRYDVSPLIGMGHASRARILATEFESRGYPVVHAVPAAAIPLVNTWTPDSQTIVAIDAANDDWTEQQQSAAHIVLDTLWNTNAIAAHKEVTQLNKVSTARISVIDSMPPDHFICSNCTVHALLTPYLDADKYRPAPPKKTQWLMGPEYSLLGAEYEMYKQQDDSSNPPSILISCGGSDTDQLSLTITKLLIDSGVTLDVVCGPLFDSSLSSALEKIAAHHTNVHLHHQPPSLAPLIANTSLVIGRPGILRYEAAALGRPAVYLAKGYAYRDYYCGFSSSGIANIFFDTESNGQEQFATHIKQLAQQIHTDKFSNHNPIAGSLVNTNGARKFIDELLE
jgi:UDP-2,4-diacetamido-2,4,6-trideoxy-beta-L-altropyranose hydrolase